MDRIRSGNGLGEEWRSKIGGFKSIFRRNDAVIQGCQKALCLGARTGQEVVALEELGLDAIGIDLVPCPPHVEAGDIHNLRFEDASFDLIFTNIVDHSIDPSKFFSEIERVCAPGGVIMIHLCLGPDIDRSEEHTSELQSLMRISYAVL